ncbi:hypothetical protein P7H17_27065 [Paenibacillus larvae]|nr:hypothetical protein [Paenibacillus larvae]MDT2288994.1 hypothetical protein [Paenibacillus larvae]
MTMQISLSRSLNDALIRGAGLEYDIKTLKRLGKVQEQGNESAVRSYDQLANVRKMNWGSPRADRQRKRKAEEITRRCWS